MLRIDSNLVVKVAILMLVTIYSRRPPCAGVVSKGMTTSYYPAREGGTPGSSPGVGNPFSHFAPTPFLLTMPTMSLDVVGGAILGVFMQNVLKTRFSSEVKQEQKVACSIHPRQSLFQRGFVPPYISF